MLKFSKKNSVISTSSCDMLNGPAKSKWGQIPTSPICSAGPVPHYANSEVLEFIV
jgi:hypothetical protein